MTKHKSLVLLVVSGSFMILLSSLTPAGASSANLSHAYRAQTPIDGGKIVSLDPIRAGYVVPATTSNATKLLGVVVAPQDSLLEIDPSTSSVQVTTSGTVTVYVSTINGPIDVGDQVSVSPFEGVGQKAEQGSYVVGLAQTSLKDGQNDSTQQTVTDKNNTKKAISVGYVRLNIGVGTGTISGSVQLNGLQKLGKSLTGHTISTARIVMSLVVALIAIVAIITLMYTSIFGGIISIGRNPLAKYAVIRTLIIVLSMALGVGVVAAVTIVFLLQ